MSKAKSVELKQGAISKEEFEKRKNIENKLKGEKRISKTPPKTLCKNAKKIYKNIINSVPKEFLNNTDEYVVSIIADSIAKMEECQKIINEEGILVKYTNSAGATNIDQNKAILIYNKYCEIFKKYIGEIGLSPSARSKLAMISNDLEKKEDDMLLKVLKGETD